MCENDNSINYILSIVQGGGRQDDGIRALPLRHGLRRRSSLRLRNSTRRRIPKKGTWTIHDAGTKPINQQTKNRSLNLELC